MASEACCAAGQPVVAEYTPQGARHNVGDLEVYVVGAGPPVLIIYDIFGFSFSQVFQMADRIASSGFMVAMPDVFHGKPWTMARFPPKPEDNFMDWLTSISDYPGKVKPDVEASLAVLKQKGAEEGKCGVIGFCWGAAMALAMGADNGSAVGAVCCAHPSFGILPDEGADMTQGLQCPMALLPAHGDNIEKVQKALEGKPFAGKCVVKEFPDQAHGFMAARGDFSDPKVAAAAAEGAEIFAKFLKDNLLTS
mmetsp:Transcript_9609/g.27518  ORF Transcript_9609/g.27518 Transcript_9609/m.27518 type:complete len:251 (+) Transcript_9609:118-870(+)|eukprot:CAMPEP_0117669226 /NCGR_PEP_ID=MMETSP0804-20121206/12007_1 /TAXON_ID=1074897 /ORGANISM="Tetraselmis astigmatica, Strain CCMP880" /LENGTH=250 /DNA_ID=CAMNT_0005477245 /DNA_START=49 /DNA_END=801 /DNA_ORIENTATION=-